MTTSLSDLKSSVPESKPTQNIMYDPNVKEENKVVHTEAKKDDMNELITNIRDNKDFVSLPSSHIPTTTTHISNDPGITPNYIPQPNIPNMIESDEEYIAINQTKPLKEKKENENEKFILPIIVFLAILALNTPITLKYIQKIVPKIFRKDGHPEWYYSAIKGAIVAGIVYYFLYYE